MTFDLDVFRSAVETDANSLTDSFKGTFAIERKSLEDNINTLTTRVEERDEILEVRRVRLLQDFIQTESILGTLTSQQQALGSIAPISVAIQYGSLGRKSLEENDVESAHLALSRSRDFVTELLGGLSDKHDPLLMMRMKQLFFSAYLHLAEGERDRDASRVNAALAILKTHHETWIELGQHLKPIAHDSAMARPSGDARAWRA